MRFTWSGHRPAQCQKKGDLCHIQMCIRDRDLEAAKDGKTYGYRAGLALETQFYPDTPNKPQFPSSVFGPDRPYHTVTEYRFV